MNVREAFRETPEIQVTSAVPEWICLCVPPQVEFKDKVVGYFRKELFSDLPGDLCEKLSTALDELLGNAIEHGCTTEPKGDIELLLLRTKRLIQIQVRDAGTGFSLSTVPHAAVNNPPDDPLRHIEYRSQMGMRPGGFGILLVKQIADDLIYNEHGNEVVLVKYL